MKDTLVFDINDLRYEDSKVYEVRIPPTALELPLEDTEFILPLACTIALFRQDANNIYVTGDIISTIAVECRRCLKQFQVDIASTLELLFCPMEKKTQSKDGNSKLLQSIEELFQSEERYYDGDTLELSEDVRQALVLEIPVWPLCAQTCEGLCSACGAELNLGTCSCDIAESVDTAVQQRPSNPFSVLSTLLPETDNRNMSDDLQPSIEQRVGEEE